MSSAYVIGQTTLASTMLAAEELLALQLGQLEVQVSLGVLLAELEQQISGAYSEKERAEKNTEGMQFRLELQQGKVEELEGAGKTSCRDTTNAWARL